MAQTGRSELRYVAGSFKTGTFPPQHFGKTKFVVPFVHLLRVSPEAQPLLIFPSLLIISDLCGFRGGI